MNPHNNKTQECNKASHIRLTNTPTSGTATPRTTDLAMQDSMGSIAHTEATIKGIVAIVAIANTHGDTAITDTTATIKGSINNRERNYRIIIHHSMGIPHTLTSHL
jgi:hypothetical protein